MKAFIGEDENFNLNSRFNRQPVKLFEYWSNLFMSSLCGETDQPGSLATGVLYP